MNLPSVSRILDITMPIEKREALNAWRRRIGFEKAEGIIQAAMERGREIDRQVDLYRLEGACADERISGYLNGFDFVHHELSVRSEAGRYQGRFDAVLRINDRNILVDFKGSTRKKPVKYLVDYRLQLGAYYGACCEMGIGVDVACVVLFIDDTPTPQLYWQQLPELTQSHVEFLQRVGQYERMNAQAFTPESK